MGLIMHMIIIRDDRNSGKIVINYQPLKAGGKWFASDKKTANKPIKVEKVKKKHKQKQNE